MEPTLKRPVAASQRAGMSLLVFHAATARNVPVGVGTTLVVGRASPADLIIDDPSVSRSHARLEVTPEGVRFEDLGSTNGVLLNGAMVRAGRFVVGDELRIGDASITLHRSRGGDDLHGLDTYDQLFAAISAELVRARAFNRSLTVMMIAATDSTGSIQQLMQSGHLAPLSSWISSVLGALRPVDQAAPYSNTIIAALFPETGTSEAQAISATIHAADPRTRIATASFPGDGSSADEVIAVVRERLLTGASSTYGDENVPSAARPAFVYGPRMRPLLLSIERAAPSAIPVLVVGETGTGKENVARRIHEQSPRAAMTFRAVNCAAIPSTLLESMLFGHEKGAFTGADKLSKGLFEQASGGTVFLDEIGELPPSAQAALLRVLENKSLMRVGGDREITVDVRVVAATHRDLEEMAETNAFRKDLLFRLNAFAVELPPLRERADEIEALCAHFISLVGAGGRVRKLHPDTLKVFHRYGWPGNIRELRNVIERAVLVATADEIRVEDLPPRIRSSVGSSSRATMAPPTSTADALRGAEALLSTASTARDDDSSADVPGDFKDRVRRRMQDYEKQLILDALNTHAGNQTAAAKALQIPLRTLTHKMRELGIKR